MATDRQMNNPATRTSRIYFLAPLVIVAVLVAVALMVLPASAASFTVTKTADTNDGVCNSDCSLREAIGAANALAGADTITLPAGAYTLTIPGENEDANATGDLDIRSDLTINGAGAASTIIQACDSSGGPCAGIDRVLDVHTGATATISGVTIRNGDTSDFPLNGGGINNDGTLTLTKSTVSGNSVSNGLNAGGGIFSNGALTVTDSTVSGNSALGGGGISNNGGTLTLDNSTVSGNSASGNGGGIYTPGGTVTINNSTVSGNSAGTGSFGGGIFGTVVLKNTIVANSPSGGNCYGGPVTSSGHNLSSDGSCAFSGPGDLNNTDPRLGPLASNGGPTKTHELLFGSPAIDAGSSDCPPPATDQRGVARPQGAICDIGAYEYYPAVGGLVDLVTTGGGDGGSGMTVLLAGLLLAFAATGAAAVGFRRASSR